MRPRVVGPRQVLLAALVLSAAGKASLLPEGELHAYMTEATSFCYQRLLADPTCCKDQHVAQAVRHKDVLRRGGEWTCGSSGSANACVDDRKGPRGQDAFWWPQAADCSTPRVLYVHGGGWQRHGPRQASYDVFGAYLSQVGGATVLVPDYPLVPVGNYEAILGVETAGESSERGR
ncbi:est [Symbiodinium natans]|uniref:Est protein n=1 Tax=Symbiodinium natans TaxID=878477 RepID=A0A812PLW3_9DINO|nr:est [Symbiodinium natans]